MSFRRPRGLLGAALLLLVLPAALAAAADPDRLPSKPGSPELYISITHPASSAPAPTAILLHGAAGLTEEQESSFRRWSAWLAERGIASMVLDSQRGRHVRGEAFRGDISAYLTVLHDRAADIQRGLDYLATAGWADPNRLFLVGQSQGAMAAMLGALNGTFKAPQIALYLPCGPVRLQADYVHTDLKTFPQTLWVLAELDEVGPVADCHVLERTLKGGGAPSLEVVTISQAHHGFDLPVAGLGGSGPRIIFNPVARAQAELEVEKFLRRIGLER